MRALTWRYATLSVLILLLCGETGAVAWTLVRFVRITHWPTGIRCSGGDALRSTVDNLREGTWFHLIRVRREGGVTVGGVDPDSPAQRAGLLPGDFIVSVNGIELKAHPAAYFQVRLRSRPGDRIALAWLRRGREHAGVLTLDRLPEVRYAAQVKGNALALGVAAMAWFQHGPSLILPVVLLCFGAWMGFRGLRHRTAFPCALLFLAMALTTSPARVPMMAGWPAGTPLLMVGLIVLGNLLQTFLLFRILTVFPAPTALGSWMRRRQWLVLSPFFLWPVLDLIYFGRLVYGWQDGVVRFISHVVQPVPDPVYPLARVLLAGVLLLAQRRVAPRRQRLRLHFIEFGFLAAFVLAPVWAIVRPGTALASWGLLPFHGALLPVVAWFLDRILYVALKCLLPLSFAYAILAHRVFGLRFVFGKGLRYVLTAPGIQGLAGFSGFILLTNMLTRLPLGVVLAASLAAGITFTLLGGWIWVRDPVVRYFDRRLFRDRYEARCRLFDIGRALSRLRNSEAMLERAGRAMIETLDLSFAAIYLYDDASRRLSVRWHGIHDAPGQGRGGDASFFEAEAGRMETILQAIPEDRPVLECAPPSDALQTGEEADTTAGFEGVALIRGAKGVLGGLALGAKRSEEPFSEDDRELVLVLVTELGLALENLGLQEAAWREMECGRQRLAMLSRRLVNTQETERRHLARELHDEAGQALIALKISLESLREDLPEGTEAIQDSLREAATLTGETLERLRSLAHDLRPPALDHLGLNAALEGLCQAFARHTGTPVTYVGIEGTALPHPVDICLYRFLQEALTNCAKHALARHIEVSLRQEASSIVLSVTDDGQGFDPDGALATPHPTGMGMTGMLERLELSGGRLDIRSRPGGGTRLTALLPREAP